MDQMIIELVLANPKAVSILAGLMTVRLVMKPICEAYISYVEKSESKEDDEKLKAFLDHKATKAVLWVVDYLLSIKLPK
jgi:hypothetical protein